MSAPDVVRSARPSLDRRTKRRGGSRAIHVAGLRGQVGAGFTARHGDLAARAQELLSLRPLSLDVDGQVCTIDGGHVSSTEPTDAIRIRVEQRVLSDLVSGTTSTYGLVFDGGLDVRPDHVAELLAWEHVLRALFDGLPLYEPGQLTLDDREGRPLDLDRRFVPSDDDTELAHFLATAGFAHLSGWIDPSLLAAVDAEVSEAARSARRDAPHRWWARLDDGSEVCVRVMYILRESPTLAALVEGEVFDRIGSLFDDGHRRFPDRPQSSEALIKPVGVVEGIADFPWHRDCSFGGHDHRCAAYAVGLPLGATNADAGHLRVVAGSHLVSVPAPNLVPDYDAGLPVVSLHTDPGDLTIHVGCVLHGTRPPRARRRAVVYTTYGLPELDQPSDC